MAAAKTQTGRPARLGTPQPHRLFSFWPAVNCDGCSETHAGLAQNRYFEDLAFLNYLKYLQYWRQPAYAKFLM